MGFGATDQSPQTQTASFTGDALLALSTTSAVASAD
jgi:hypothetical protein